MYPAQALFDGLYTVDDLPDSFIVKYGQTLKEFKKGFGLTQYAATYAPEDYSGGFDAIWQDGGLWNAGVGLPEDWGLGDFPCLFGSVSENLMEDQFADTYTITSEFNSAIVTRFNLCLWLGVDSCGRQASILYPDVPPRNTDVVKWTVGIYSNEMGCGNFFNGIYGIKQGFQNTPTGIYIDDQLGRFYSVTVS
jgi:hypothetical protein